MSKKNGFAFIQNVQHMLVLNQYRLSVNNYSSHLDIGVCSAPDNRSLSLCM